MAVPRRNYAQGGRTLIQRLAFLIQGFCAVVTQKLRQEPVQIDQQDLPEAGQGLSVRYPRSNKIVVNLVEHSLWDEIAAGAKMSDRMVAANDVLPEEKVAAGAAAVGIEMAPEPSSSAAVVMAAAGLAVVAYLWSVIVL